MKDNPCIYCFLPASCFSCDKIKVSLPKNIKKRKPPIRENIKASWEILNSFTREQLRDYAKENGIKRGRDKGDTICNIIDEGKCFISISLL